MIEHGWPTCKVTGYPVPHLRAICANPIDLHSTIKWSVLLGNSVSSPNDYKSSVQIRDPLSGAASPLTK
jgi:hypothetical protein